MSKSRVIVIVVISIFAVGSHLSRAQVLDVNGDGKVGPHEALELSRQWQKTAAPLIEPSTNAERLDGLDSSQFLRSDVSDEFVGPKLTVDGALDVGIAGISSHDVNIFGAAEGSRLFWDESLGAFRAGRATGEQWDPSNIGLNSVAMGYNTTASGFGSTAMGFSTTASGYFSTAMGRQTTASESYSTAMGRRTTASGPASTAMGFGTTASGNVSTAMGLYTTAGGYASTAMGRGTTTSGRHSTAMGYDTVSSGISSTAMGFRTTASGDGSFAAGGSPNIGIDRRSIASGDWSTAMGKDSAASGFASFAVGGGNVNDPGPTATGDFSIAMGRSTTASGNSSTAMGFYTIASGDRSTAIGYRTTASGFASTSMGRSTIASGIFSMAFGEEIEALGSHTVAIALNNQNGTVVAASNTMAIMGGNVGIGSVAPTTRLHVEDNVAGFVLSVINDGCDANHAGIVIQAGSDDGSGTTDYLLALDGDGDPVGALRNDSGTFAVVDLSDRKSKTNIRNTEVDALSIIEGLRVVDFNRKAMPYGPTIHGFIAQEAQEVFPEMVTRLDEDLLGVTKDSLIPILTKAIQEQQKTMAQLRRRGREQLERIQDQELAFHDQQIQIDELRELINSRLPEN